MKTEERNVSSGSGPAFDIKAQAVFLSGTDDIRHQAGSGRRNDPETVCALKTFLDCFRFPFHIHRHETGVSRLKIRVPYHKITVGTADGIFFPANVMHSSETETACRVFIDKDIHPGHTSRYKLTVIGRIVSIALGVMQGTEIFS